MEKYSIKIQLLWDVGVPSTFTIDVSYNSEAVSHAIEKFKALWEREFIGLLSDSPFGFTVETPLPTGLNEDDELLYGGEELSFAIDNQEAMLPLLEKYLRENYAKQILQRRLDELMEEYHSLVPTSCVYGCELFVCECTGCDNHDAGKDCRGGAD